MDMIDRMMIEKYAARRDPNRHALQAPIDIYDLARLALRLARKLEAYERQDAALLGTVAGWRDAARSGAADIDPETLTRCADLLATLIDPDPDTTPTDTRPPA